MDPRYTDSVITYTDQWIPILPGTDNAMMDAMAYVIVQENLQDQHFLDTYCLGFDPEHMPKGVPGSESYLSYLQRKNDGIAKTPQWAEKICKVTAHTITQLAVEYAQTKPAALIAGWSMGRSSAGEHTCRGSANLCCMTGSVGKLGGWAGAYGGISRPEAVGVPVLKNPVPYSINLNQQLDMLEDYRKITPTNGLKGGNALKTPIKMCIHLRQLHHVHESRCQSGYKTLDRSEQCRIHCGSRCLYDANLPVDWMRDVCSLGLSRSSAKAVAKKSGSNFFWMKPERSSPLSRAGRAKQGIAYLPYKTPAIAFQQEIENPAEHPFTTPSGKIELCSKRLYEMKDPEIPATAH